MRAFFFTVVVRRALVAAVFFLGDRLVVEALFVEALFFVAVRLTAAFFLGERFAVVFLVAVRAVFLAGVFFLGERFAAVFVVLVLTDFFFVVAMFLGSLLAGTQWFSASVSPGVPSQGKHVAFRLCAGQRQRMYSRSMPHSPTRFIDDASHFRSKNRPRPRGNVMNSPGRTLDNLRMTCIPCNTSIPF